MSESQSHDSPAPKSDPIVGMELGNYKIVELIGEGGMGAVYAARHPVLGREVAVKVLSRKFCDEEDFLARFRQEALAANRVGHEVIVEATDFGELPDGRSYYVMDRLQGESLGVMMDRRGAIPLAETAELILPVMDALQAAHESGVIHRDLKPDNIFLQKGRKGRIQPKLLDFGLAKMLEVDHTGTNVTTQTGLLLGTPLYMPPEQFSGKPETLGPWTDVYALAGVIYHMLAARPPYDEHGFADLLMQHMQAPIPSICDRKAGMPQALDDALHLALAKKPDERFQNMRAFRQAFEAAVRTAADLGIGATIRPTTADDLFPRRRPEARDVITVAERQPPANKASPAEPAPPAAVAPPAEPAPLAEPAPPEEPVAEETPTPESLPFRDERPGMEPRPAGAPAAGAPAARTAAGKVVAVAQPKPPKDPFAEVEFTEKVTRPAAKRRGLGTVVLVALILGVAGAGGYGLWRHFQTPAPPRGGTLVVDAQPKGALIRIDNETVWSPSPVRRSLAVGSHRVTIKKPGFDSIETWVSVRPGKRTSLALDLLPSGGPAPQPDTPMRPDEPGASAAAMAQPGSPARPADMGAAPVALRPDMRPGRRPGRNPRGSMRLPQTRPVMDNPPAMTSGGMAPGLASLLTRPPDIGAAIRRVYPQLKACFLEAKPGSAILKKRLRVALRVGTSGKVASARVSPGVLAATAVGRCIRRKASAWKLPPYPNPYTYAFSVRFASN